MLKLNNLQDKIVSCTDDREAILIQSELVEILDATFQDDELLAMMYLNGKAQDNGRDN